MNKKCLRYRDSWINSDTGREYKADVLVDPSSKMYGPLSEKTVHRPTVRAIWEGVIEREAILAECEDERARERERHTKMTILKGRYDLPDEMAYDENRVEFSQAIGRVLRMPPGKVQLQPYPSFTLHPYQEAAIRELMKAPPRPFFIDSEHPALYDQLIDYKSQVIDPAWSERISSLKESPAYKALTASLNGKCVCPLCTGGFESKNMVMMTSTDKHQIFMSESQRDRLQRLANTAFAFSAVKARPLPLEELSKATKPVEPPKKHERLSPLQRSLLAAYLKPKN